MPAALSGALILVGTVTTVLAGGCTEEEQKPRISLASVERCERGLREGATLTWVEAYRVYHRECAEIRAEPGCRDAYLKAADATDTDRPGILAEGCGKAYCKILGADQFELCRPDFQPTPTLMAAAWPKFHDAALQYDAGPFYRRLSVAIALFYVKTMKSAGGSPVGTRAAAADIPAQSPASPATSALRNNGVR
jgi:hypothetical protein